MKQTVFKYPLRVDDIQEVTLPKGAKILTINEQNDKLYLWALINTEELETETIKIRCAGTGHWIEEEIIDFIGTVFMVNGAIVFHFFKIK